MQLTRFDENLFFFPLGLDPQAAAVSALGNTCQRRPSEGAVPLVKL